MGYRTRIEWADSSWNPWLGCTKVSPGCRNCYAERIEERYGRDFSVVRRVAPRTFAGPLRWKEPRMIFTCSMSDFFHEDADPWRPEAWEIIRKTPWHTYQILTKRPERIDVCLPQDWDQGWPHVWLGTSVESQTYDYRIAQLAEVPAKVRFLSCEPLLGPLNLDFDPGYFWFSSIGWVIVGGESDPTAPRPMEPSWVRSIRDFCQAWETPFFFKQWGGRSKVDGVWGGRVLDGRIWDGMPPAKRVAA